ncbi:MAG TPA: hypothetical protein VIR00_05590 [Micromonosporaceae bacterium]
MPAPTAVTAPDRADLRSRLLVVQFWVGITLAPFAALLLIFGGTAAAAVVAIIAVVVLALSVMLRSDLGPSARANSVTADEMNALREDVRADITTAARATHRALSERMSRLEESVAGVQRLAESFAGIRRLEDAIAGVQREVEAARAVAIEARAAVDNQRELPMPPPRRPAAVVGSVPGVVRHTETVVTRSMYVDRPADEFERPSGSTVYGSASRSAAGRAAIGGAVNGSTTYGSAGRRPDVAADQDRDDPDRHDSIHPDLGRPDLGRPDLGRHDSGRHDSGRPDSGRHDDGRHDTGAHDGDRSDVGRGPARWIDVEAPMPRQRESRAESQRRDESLDGSPRRDEPWHESSSDWSRREALSDRRAGDNRGGVDDRADSHESWTEQRLRAYLPQLRESLGYRSGSLGEQSDSSGDLANDARWSQMRDGDRWAEVLSDDRGRELRMAERREERHVDETGTQLRIVDRWSSVREERIPPAADHTPPRETRAERRRRVEHDDRDEMYADAVTRAELPHPRRAPDELRAERPSGEVARGWRDVRSGVIEPDHSDRYEPSRYDGPSQNRPSRDTPDRGARPQESPSYDSFSYDSLSHDDVGVYRRPSDRSASGRAVPDVRSDDPYANGWVDDRAAARRSRNAPSASQRDGGDFPAARRDRDSGDIPAARRDRDSGESPPARRSERAAYEERDDRWVREPSQRSSGRRPQLDFEVTDDRWN